MSVSETVSELYFVDGKSAQGSFSKENATLGLLRTGELKTVPVESGPVSPRLLERYGCQTSHFDVLKIDVEGHEIEAVRGLSQLTFSFVLIEIAPERKNGFSEDMFLDELKERFGSNPEVLWRGDRTSPETPYNLLCKM